MHAAQERRRDGVPPVWLEFFSGSERVHQAHEATEALSAAVSAIEAGPGMNGMNATDQLEIRVKIRTLIESTPHIKWPRILSTWWQGEW